MVRQGLKGHPSDNPGQEVLIGHRSRKRISDFRLHRPCSQEEAWNIWSQGGPFCTFMAGGVDLINDLKRGERLDDLIALGHLQELKGVKIFTDHITLGVLTSHHELGSADLPPPFDALSNIWRDVANPRVRFKGTLGGNIVAANPNYDVTPCLEALGALTTGRMRDGTVARLTPGEAASCGRGVFLSEIFIPRRAIAFSYERNERPFASVAAAVFDSGKQGQSLRIAVGCAFDRVIAVEFNLPQAPSLNQLAGIRDEIVARLMASLPAARSDASASGRYRSHLIGILAARAIQKLSGAL